HGEFEAGLAASASVIPSSIRMAAIMVCFVILCLPVGDQDDLDNLKARKFTRENASQIRLKVQITLKLFVNERTNSGQIGLFLWLFCDFGLFAVCHSVTLTRVHLSEGCFQPKRLSSVVLVWMVANSIAKPPWK